MRSREDLFPAEMKIEGFRKYPNAAKEWGWQYVFPARAVAVDPRTGVTRRHHLDPSVIIKATKVAAPMALPKARRRRCAGSDVSPPKRPPTAWPECKPSGFYCANAPRQCSGPAPRARLLPLSALAEHRHDLLGRLRRVRGAYSGTSSSGTPRPALRLWRATSISRQEALEAP